MIIVSELDHFGFFKVVDLQLLEATLKEFLLVGLKVPFGSVFEKVEDIDQTSSQLQIFFLGLRGVLEDAEFHQSLRVEREDDGAKIERGEEFFQILILGIVIFHFLTSCGNIVSSGEVKIAISLCLSYFFRKKV